MPVRKPANGDRVECDGRRGTLVDVHQSGAWSVLFDDGPKRRSTVEPGVRLSGRRRTCDRCGAKDHHPFACPEPGP